jgi:hypothetical protein
MLAVLWTDPPTGDAGRAVVEKGVGERGYKDLVEGFRIKLAAAATARAQS